MFKFEGYYGVFFGPAVVLSVIVYFIITSGGVIVQSQPKVVQINVTSTGKGGWLGSGAYVSSDGLILTCAHLFAHDAKYIFVLSDSGQRTIGELVRLDKTNDLALVKTFVVHPVPFFQLGHEPLRGDTVYSFGSPLGHQHSVSKGIVENVNDGKDHWTMHGASLNPGNSGGPLVDGAGNLVGVNVTSWQVPGFAGIPQNAANMDNAVALKFIRKILGD